MNQKALWFDVESRYKATETKPFHIQSKLWFDVELRYKATTSSTFIAFCMLWFDVESRYKTTDVKAYRERLCCGLVSVRPHGKRKGYHVNRYGKEKPVLMWAESGTRMRNIGKKVNYFTSRNRYTGKRTRDYIRGGASRGRMPKYEFIKHTDEKAGGQTEENLFNEFKKNVYRAAETM